MFLNLWNSSNASGTGGIGPALPLHELLFPNSAYANFDGITTRRIPPGLIGGMSDIPTIASSSPDIVDPSPSFQRYGAPLSAVE
eukprot:CAMPEP_0194211914 /NCGR_PEP_ID=MMETSP0156-20130528/11309_1 /TAXON_ID=33649 /ORGANISM="Thalassionema nitzschioides, Strain L26-B" /LENGTH=83 /DNA_ID=CAMNT_0038939603 /DNA_START=92 /DNA_END=343 /DNA_ORIENTATION=-